MKNKSNKIYESNYGLLNLFGFVLLITLLPFMILEVVWYNVLVIIVVDILFILFFLKFFSQRAILFDDKIHLITPFDDEPFVIMNKDILSVRYVIGNQIESGPANFMFKFKNRRNLLFAFAERKKAAEIIKMYSEYNVPIKLGPYAADELYQFGVVTDKKGNVLSKEEQEEITWVSNYE